MRKDGRTDMITLIVAFRNFANAPPPQKKTKTYGIGIQYHK